MTGFNYAFLPALPEMVILFTACVALLGDLFLKQYCRSIALVSASIGLLIAAVISYVFLDQYGQIKFNGLFISDDIAQLLKLFIYLTVFLSFIYSKHYLDERKMPSGDYYVLGLFATLGMMIMVSAHSLLTLYLGLELLSLPLYAMTACRRSESNGSEAAMKYFVMGSIASAMLLYGISLLYGATGTLDFADLAKYFLSDHPDNHGLLSFALVFMLIGLSFKLAVVPFHMWAPDVYEGAPTAVTLFISAAPKIAAIGVTIRLLTYALPSLVGIWQQVILLMALSSALLGNLLAVVQKNLKRLLAYSTISHMGYGLFGLLSASTAGYAASVFYVLVYALMSVASLGFLVILSRSTIEIENIKDLAGLNQRNPWLALMMMIVLLSMAGIPPTVGFFAKFVVLKALVETNMTWVAILGLLFAVIGAYYYLNIIKVMYFDEAKDSNPIRLDRSTTALFSANALSILYFGLMPSGLISICLNVFAA